MKTTWETLFAGGCRPADAARLMRCSAAEARRQLDRARSAFNAERAAERMMNRACAAISNDASYEAMQLWGTAKLGYGVSLEKTGDCTFAHMLGR